MKNTAVTGLVALLALAVGYIVGTERAGSPAPTAVAGPTEVSTQPQGNYISTDENPTLTIWTFNGGQVVEAKRYRLTSRSQEGTDVTVEELVTTVYPAAKKAGGK